MKAMAITVTLLIISATATGLLWYRTTTTPEPEWFQEQTIKKTDRYLPASEFRIKAKVARRDKRIMSQRLRDYIDTHHGKTFNRGTVHDVYKVRTKDRQVAETLLALDSQAYALTPGYAQWPNVDKPQIPENDMYEVRVKLRAASHQPGYVRAASASTTVTGLLIIANIVTMTMAYDRRKETRGET